MGSEHENIVKEAYRQSEMSLNSDISIALAADSRAMAFCGWMVASAALMAGLAPDSPSSEFLVGAFFLLASAGVAGFSARPLEMRAPGTKFSDWNTEVKNGDALIEELTAMGQYNDTHSTKNKKILKANGKLLWWAYILALFGLGVPLIVNLPEIIEWIFGAKQ